MNERQTLRLLGWSIGTVVVAAYVLGGISLALM
jgi:hypothetical protein